MNSTISYDRFVENIDFDKLYENPNVIDMLLVEHYEKLSSYLEFLSQHGLMSPESVTFYLNKSYNIKYNFVTQELTFSGENTNGDEVRKTVICDGICLYDPHKKILNHLEYGITVLYEISRYHKNINDGFWGTICEPLGPHEQHYSSVYLHGLGVGNMTVSEKGIYFEVYREDTNEVPVGPIDYNECLKNGTVCEPITYIIRYHYLSLLHNLIYITIKEGEIPKDNEDLIKLKLKLITDSIIEIDGQSESEKEDESESESEDKSENESESEKGEETKAPRYNLRKKRRLGD